ETNGGPGVPTMGTFNGQHVYAAPGVYTVKVIVNDDDAGTSMREFTVTVNAVQPTLTVPPDQSIFEGDQVAFTSQFTDPQPGGATSYSFTIDWGDGKQSSGATGLSDGQSGSFNGSHFYADDGLYTVTVTLFADDRSVTETFKVAVDNLPPEI